MNFRCLCGESLSDVASPNNVEHILLADAAIERLQNLVDKEVEADGEIQMWPEHWEDAGAVDIWKCPTCKRLYLGARGDPSQIQVYKIEQVGL